MKRRSFLSAMLALFIPKPAPLPRLRRCRYVNFGRGTFLMLHAKERVMTEAEVVAEMKAKHKRA